RKLVGKSLSELRLTVLDLHTKPTYWHQPLPPSPYAANVAKLQHRVRHPLQVIVEMAALDLIARRASVPLYLLFGGAWRDRVRAARGGRLRWDRRPRPAATRPGPSCPGPWVPRGTWTAWWRPARAPSWRGVPPCPVS